MIPCAFLFCWSITLLSARREDYHYGASCPCRWDCKSTHETGQTPSSEVLDLASLRQVLSSTRNILFTSGQMWGGTRNLFPLVEQRATPPIFVCYFALNEAVPGRRKFVVTGPCLCSVLKLSLPQSTTIFHNTIFEPFEKLTWILLLPFSAKSPFHCPQHTYPVAQ